MSLHLPTLDTDRMDVHATPDGRVHVYIGGHCALLTMSVEQACTLATGLQNAAVQASACVPVEESA